MYSLAAFARLALFLVSGFPVRHLTAFAAVADAAALGARLEQAMEASLLTALRIVAKLLSRRIHLQLHALNSNGPVQITCSLRPKCGQ